MEGGRENKEEERRNRKGGGEREKQKEGEKREQVTTEKSTNPMSVFRGFTDRAAAKTEKRDDAGLQWCSLFKRMLIFTSAEIITNSEHKKKINLLSLLDAKNPTATVADDFQSPHLFQIQCLCIAGFFPTSTFVPVPQERDLKGRSCPNHQSPRAVSRMMHCVEMA